MAGRILSRQYTAMALPEVRRLLYTYRRYWHAGGLVPSYTPDTGRLDLTDVYREEIGHTYRLYDWRSVSLQISSNRKQECQRLTICRL